MKFSGLLFVAQCALRTLRILTGIHDRIVFADQGMSPLSRLPHQHRDMGGETIRPDGFARASSNMPPAFPLGIINIIVENVDNFFVRFSSERTFFVELCR